MSKKVLFIDVDGTLVGFKDGQQYIPQSAISGIQKARENGHLAFLCTGRSHAEIGSIMDIGFDGVIGAAGGYVTYLDKTIFHKQLEEQAIKEIVQYLNDNKVAFYLESNTGLYCNDDMLEFNRKYFASASSNFIQLCKPLKEADLTDINKISFLSATLSYKDIEEKYGNDFYMVKASWGVEDTEAGEISNKGINKATAIHFLLDYLNYDEVETYGFGDSMNDLEMFNCVNHAIAMGNSRHGVKDYAEFITKDVIDDGIEFALKHYHLV